MRIVRLHIENFRAIKTATLFPEKHNVYLGPNNIGKTSILEALNLLLNPEISPRSGVIDENDFHHRAYRALAPEVLGAQGAVVSTEEKARSDVGDAPARDNSQGAASPPPETGEVVAPASHISIEPAPTIVIEAVLTDLTDEDIKEQFASVLVPWNEATNCVVEGTEAGDDPFDGMQPAIRVRFEGWYDDEEDDFAIRTFFRTDPSLERDAFPTCGKAHKRAIGFLIYRDFRALQRPITLDSSGLFARLLQSQEATPKTFEDVLSRLQGAASPLFGDQNFARVVNEYRQELGRYLPLDPTGEGQGHLSFEISDRTRDELKAISQLYVNDALPMPLQRMGAGTRSLSLLAVLLLITRKRNRGILALEEPETFLFPHAQRRIVDEVLGLASQTFVTTHSPYVLERMPLQSYQRITRSAVSFTTEPIVKTAKGGRQMRDRHRRQLAEGLLGRAAIVVEEESIRQWILRTSTLLHGSTYAGTKRAALELHGVAVLTAEGNGEVAKLAALLTQAGILAIGFLDQVKDSDLQVFLKHNVPLVFHPKRNLEDLLANALARPILEEVLSAPSNYKKNVYEKAGLALLDESELRAKAKTFLENHKGYLPFHEEILEGLTENDMPSALKQIVCLGAELAEGVVPDSQSLIAP